MADFMSRLFGKRKPKPEPVEDRTLRELRVAWQNLEKGKRYHYPDRGWSGRFQGEPSDSYTAWMIFDEVGQCGVDPRKLVALPEPIQ